MKDSLASMGLSLWFFKGSSRGSCEFVGVVNNRKLPYYFGVFVLGYFCLYSMHTWFPGLESLEITQYFVTKPFLFKLPGMNFVIN
jgi:hypothetical protein